MPKKKAAPNSAAVWPTVKFTFDVHWGASFRMSFQEITGVGSGADAPDYRDGAKKPKPRPTGIAKVGSLQLKRGVVAESAEFVAFLRAFQAGRPPRANVVIHLLDEKAQAAATWHVSKAWPTKVALSEVRDAAEITLESLELAYETIALASV